MNLESELVFIVGPGGTGKSTTGKILAEKLNYDFVDEDLVFCERIALIPDYIHEYGYRAYCEANSLLVDQLLSECPSRAVMSMSSGFLVHEDSPELVVKHLQLLAKSGISILLMPSRSLEEARGIIVARQLSRGFLDTTEEHERTVINRRHPLYLKYGDIQIFSYQSSEEIADSMFSELNTLGLPR